MLPVEFEEAFDLHFQLTWQLVATIEPPEDRHPLQKLLVVVSLRQLPLPLDHLLQEANEVREQGDSEHHDDRADDLFGNRDRAHVTVTNRRQSCQPVVHRLGQNR